MQRLPVSTAAFIYAPPIGGVSPFEGPTSMALIDQRSIVKHASDA